MKKKQNRDSTLDAFFLSLSQRRKKKQATKQATMATINIGSENASDVFYR